MKQRHFTQAESYSSFDKNTRAMAQTGNLAGKK